MTVSQITEKYHVSTEGKTVSEVLDELARAGATDLELYIIRGFVALITVAP